MDHEEQRDDFMRTMQRSTKRRRQMTHLDHNHSLVDYIESLPAGSTLPEHQLSFDRLKEIPVDAIDIDIDADSDISEDEREERDAYNAHVEVHFDEYAEALVGRFNKRRDDIQMDNERQHKEKEACQPKTRRWNPLVGPPPLNETEQRVIESSSLFFALQLAKARWAVQEFASEHHMLAVAQQQFAPVIRAGGTTTLKTDEATCFHWMVQDEDINTSLTPKLELVCLVGKNNFQDAWLVPLDVDIVKN